MRIVSLIDEEDVIERILRHLGSGKSGADPPGETTSISGSTTASPTTTPVRAFSAT